MAFEETVTIKYNNGVKKEGVSNFGPWRMVSLKTDNNISLTAFDRDDDQPKWADIQVGETIDIKVKEATQHPRYGMQYSCSSFRRPGQPQPQAPQQPPQAQQAPAPAPTPHAPPKAPVRPQSGSQKDKTDLSIERQCAAKSACAYLGAIGVQPLAFESSFRDVFRVILECINGSPTQQAPVQQRHVPQAPTPQPPVQQPPAQQASDQHVAAAFDATAPADDELMPF